MTSARHRVLAVVALVTAIALAIGVAYTLLSGSAGQAQAVQSIKASMLIFSGREDPSWEITSPADIATLQGFLQDPPPTSPPDWPTLGWRGVLLQNQGVPDFPDLLQVFDGVIEVYISGGSVYLEDAFGLEPWLLDRMPDFDGDGLASVDEAAIHGTDPTNPNTDGDGCTDSQEVLAGLNPLDPSDATSGTCPNYLPQPAECPPGVECVPLLPGCQIVSLASYAVGTQLLDVALGIIPPDSGPRLWFHIPGGTAFLLFDPRSAERSTITVIGPADEAAFACLDAPAEWRRPLGIGQG